LSFASILDEGEEEEGEDEKLDIGDLDCKPKVSCCWGSGDCGCAARSDIGFTALDTC